MSEQASSPPKTSAVLMDFYKLGMLVFPTLILFACIDVWIPMFRWFVLLPIPTLWYVSYWISYTFYCVTVAFDTAILSTTAGWSREQTARWLIDASHYFYCGFPRSPVDELPGCMESSPGRVVLYTGLGIFIVAATHLCFRIVRHQRLAKENIKKTK